MAAAEDFLARFADGEVADMRDAVCRLDAGGEVLSIADLEARRELARWPLADAFPVRGRRGELRIGARGQAGGARLVVGEAGEVARARELLPGLQRVTRGEGRRQASFIGVSTVLLAGLVAAYVYGVPLLAPFLVNFVPPAWERRLGDTVAVQMQTAFAKNGDFTVCDADPDSIANKAINRFANAALEGTGTPFTAEVEVVHSTVPNAFALPGGKAFFFSALLQKTETPDEFAGVLAHEMGHVVHRDGMQQLISSASTGLLIGFVLGDLSGLSVAGTLGTTVVDSRFSRSAEANADRFAAETAKRLHFQPVGLANLLERVAADDTMTQAFAFLSTHPLTAERRLALEALRTNDDPGLPPAFTDSEWQAIRNMCGPVAASPVAAEQPAGTSAPLPQAGGPAAAQQPTPAPEQAGLEQQPVSSPTTDGPSASERQRDKARRQ